MDRQDLLLALLACAGGRPYSPVQLQKAAFLISKNMPNLVDQGPPFRFVPYDYGPFDSNVYAESQHLHDRGDAVIAPSGVGRWNTHAASDAGLARGSQILQRMPSETREYFESVSNWVRSQSFSSLVKSIYEAYPEMRANSVFRS
jgi:hypothetical protein